MNASTDTSLPLKDQFVAYIHDLQNRICAALEEADGKATFIEDAWQRPEGGGGGSRHGAGCQRGKLG